MTCSILILTKDEEVNIADCIASASFSDDIVVFDSFSSDRTVAIAKAAGARVFQHAFENYSAQREAARTTVDYKHEWVLAVDADERPDAELAAEIPRVLRSVPDSVAAFRVRTKDQFKGGWIRRASLYPSWHVRLYRHRRISYVPREVHEFATIDGSVENLDGHLIHYNFSKGVAQWWKRHIRYSEMEAVEILRYSGGIPAFEEFVHRDPIRRRHALKHLSYNLPFRPELKFLYLMFVRGAVLEGPRSWEYCRMWSEYQRITDQIVTEHRKGFAAKAPDFPWPTTAGAGEAESNNSAARASRSDQRPQQ